MWFLTKIILFCVLAKFVINIDFDHLRPVSNNKVTVEKFICKLHPGSKFDKNYKCLVKYIDRNNLKVDVAGNLTEPVSSLRTRTKFFYKYNTYQQAGGDLNVYVCDVLANGYRTPMMAWLFGKFSKFTSLNHKCPYAGSLYFRADNISVDEFSYPDMMPSGRYRLDITLFEDKDKILATFNIYFSISDHRIDVKSLKLLCEFKK